MIFIAGITIAFLLEYLLLSKKGKARADIVLAFWMFFIGLHLFLYYLHYSGLDIKYHMLIGLAFPLPLVHGPFLYLYVAHLTNQIPRRIIYRYIHFLLPFLMYIYLLDFIFSPAAVKIEAIQTGGEDYRAFNIINGILIVVSGVGYVTWSQIILLRHKKIIRQQFSNIEKINLNWLQYLIIGIGFIWLVVIFGEFLSNEIFGSSNYSDMFVFSAVVLFVCFLGFFGLKQTNVFLPNTALPVLTKVPESGPARKEFEKYAKSGLKETEAEQLHKRLNEFMIKDKPYLNSDLSLAKLGESFGVHTNYLSQVINERENKNFYDYINEFRIEEFKRLAADPKKKNYTILTLAYECGFNSKSAFNNFFKKFTNQTPSEFMKLKK